VYSTTSLCLCHSESCANHAIKLAMILAALYSLSSSRRLTRYRPRRILLAIILVASYSLPYSSRLTRSHTRRVLLATVHAAGVLIAILLIVVVLLASCSSRRAHRVVFITSCSSRRAHRVGLIASCRICQLSFVTDTQSNVTRVKNSGDGCDAGCLCWKREVW